MRLNMKMIINYFLNFCAMTIFFYGIFIFIYAIYKNIVENNELSYLSKLFCKLLFPAIISAILTFKHFNNI